MITILYKDPYSQLMERKDFKNESDAIKFLVALRDDYPEVQYEVIEL